MAAPVKSKPRWYVVDEHGRVTADIVEMIQRLGGELVTRLTDEPDVALFTGGADINPKLYGMDKHPSTSFDRARDGHEIYMFHHIKTLKKRPSFVGICRGGQLLNVLNGGSLWQDVSNHLGPHKVRDIKTKKEYEVSSTHHQQMVLPTQDRWKANPPTLLALATHQAKTKAGAPPGSNEEMDIEAVYYFKTRSLCFQPHPEYTRPKETFDLFKSYVDFYIHPSKAAQAA